MRILRSSIINHLFYSFKKTVTVLSSWEVSYFINQLGSQYYKLELLNSISLAINQGLVPQNIFVANRLLLSTGQIYP